MTYIEAAQQVESTKSAHLIRQRAADPQQWDCKPLFTGNKKGWVMLDLFTASAMVKVWEALDEERRALVLAKASLSRYIGFCWKVVK